MTEIEAIEELKYDCNELGKAIPCDTSWGRSFENAYEMAIQALEKQIPKKLIRKERSGMGYEYKDYYCSCGNFIGYEPPINRALENGKIPFKYCPDCGQLLDWENT